MWKTSKTDKNNDEVSEAFDCHCSPESPRARAIQRIACAAFRAELNFSGKCFSKKKNERKQHHSRKCKQQQVANDNFAFLRLKLLKRQ